MPKTATSQHPLLSSRYLSVGVIGLALAILGSTIYLASNNLRQKSREQLMEQEAEILYALWLSQEFSAESEGQIPISNRPSDQWTSVLETAGLPQVARLVPDLKGTRLFDPAGHWVTSDPNITSESNLPASEVALLASLKPVARFRQSVDLAEVSFGFHDTPPSIGPILEVSIPLHLANQKQLLGIAQFILDGKNLAVEFATLDQNLIRHGVATFLVGGGLLVLLLGLSFRQLLRVNHLLTDRTHSLLKANEELALAAKTSAVGAVTAHLIHGLKNPLSGLQTFVASHGSAAENGDASDWELAVSSTRRMQTMISEVVRVLRDEQGESAYELSINEFAEMLRTKVEVLAREAGISFHCQVAARAILSNREANLINLILYNLIQNAIQATPRGKTVTLSIQNVDDRVVCEVSDQGPGIPLVRQKLLFKPCQSAKEGGSGVGLAISKQLANCIDAELELKQSSPGGAIFSLSFQARRPVEQEDLASERRLN